MRVLASLIILLAASAIVHWRWLVPGWMFAWGDFAYFIKHDIMWSQLYNYPAVWDTVWGNGFGQTHALLFSYPLISTIGGLVKLGFSSYLLIKIFLLYPQIFLMPIGMYLLSMRIVKSSIGSIIAASVYSFNPYILLSQAGGHLHIANAYAMAPFALLCIELLFTSRKSIYIVLSSLFLFIVSTYEFRMFYIVFFICLVNLFFRFSKRNFLNFILVTLIYFILSSHWLVPLAASGSVADNPSMGRGIFGDAYMSFRQSLLFFHPFWTWGNGHANGVVQFAPQFLYLFPTLAFIGLAFGVQKAPVRIFGTVAILGILLTKQSAPPFPGFYSWLYNNFPGFYAFREASKFYILTGLGYSILIAYALAKMKNIRYFVHMCIFSIIVILSIYCFPLINGNIGSSFLNKSIPQSQIELNDFLSNQPDFFRTLWIPYYTFWDYYSQNHPNVNIYEMYIQYEDKLINKSPNKSNILSDSQHRLLDPLTQEFSNSLLDQMGIKYVIVPKKSDIEEDNVFINYGIPDRAYIVSMLNNLSYLKKVDSPIDIDVYENKGYVSLFSLSLTLPSLNNNNATSIKYTTLGPLKYSMTVPPHNDEIFLNLSQNFKSNWFTNINTIKSINNESKFTSFKLPSTNNYETLTVSFSGQEYVPITLLIYVISIISLTLYLIPKIWTKSQ